ncbi:hypothetical protein DFQ26_003315 [Actinomortierella ambigua]|nr:hypothetical protein DFQ26_003315 [Actinomortierella ambigua]
MFTTLTNLFTKPSTPIRVPNDDTTFNTKEYPNVSFVAKGNLSGSVKIVHDGDVDTGLISTRLWVHNERDSEKITITPSFDSQSCSIVLETPSGFSQPMVYHETMVRIPTTTNKLEQVYLEAPNSTLFGDLLDNLTFRAFRARFTNGTVDLKPLQASDDIEIRTSNAAISGQFEASKVHLQTSNAQISAIVRVLGAASQSAASPVVLQTSNATVDAHLDASKAVRGVQLNTQTTNGKVTMGILLAEGATSASLIDISSTNGKLEINVDGSKLGNALDVRTKTSNASITQSIMVPRYQPFQTSATSSNSSIHINLTEDFLGRFDLATSNSSVNVEGSDIHYTNEKKSVKQGSRGKGDWGFVAAKTSNSSINLRFYPATKA